MKVDVSGSGICIYIFLILYNKLNYYGKYNNNNAF